MSTPPTRITLDPALPPWENQPGETSKKHGQFITYRDLGRARTLPRAAELLQRHPVTIRKISAEFRWLERAEAHDRHLDRQYEATWLEERRRGAETDAKILGAAIGKLAQRLRTLRAEDLSPADFIRLMDVAMRHRRVLFGDPLETIVVTNEARSPLAGALEEFAGLPAAQRNARLAEMAATVARRVRAVEGSDDEDEETYPGRRSGRSVASEE
ncbi:MULTISPECIES: hypothetical protein [unclassified Streptomyces]|uniref:hypothetical protein n=1 Tax=unclassified Streptomyces TaxID=2593676 RepID=UPI0020246C22|nr:MULTISPECIES: hypothetical protein [unclassified Streptomyces]MCX4550587.1 hypothetical protein [Streptomyces sp. NBC_01500]WSC22034.1 hypothetical protein OIE60_21400 [Streptomyces sp. NBC_01766]